MTRWLALAALLIFASLAPAEQFVLFDVTFTFTKEDADNAKPSKSHFYVKGEMLNPQRPKDWTQPVDYRNGTVHIRAEVIEKPAGGEPTTWTLCYIPNKGQKNGYGCTGTKLYKEKGVYESDVSMKEFWQNDSIVWSEGIKQMDLVIKDSSGGSGHAHKRPDHEKFFPTKMRITMVQVSAGAKYDPRQVPNLPEQNESAAATEELPKSATTFEVEGQQAFLYEAPKPMAGKPWVWYAPTLKGVSLVQRPFYFEGLMRAGISIAGYDLGEVRGSPASSEKFSRFYDAMVKRGYSPKPILLGQSRGGLMMLAWGVRNPEKVQALVGIYPVFNLTSWPLKNSKAATLADYGLTEEELNQKLRELNPIEHLDGLLKHKVPIFVVHGDSDVVVPLADNTGLLKDRYQAGGGPITVKVIPGEGHKVSPSFFECAELLEFVKSQSAK